MSEQGISYWKIIFKKFSVSGLTVTEFCHQNDIGPSRFYYWKSKIAAMSSNVDNKKEFAHDFISIEEKPKKLDREITFTISGHKVTFSTLPSPSWVAQLAKEIINEPSSI